MAMAYILLPLDLVPAVPLPWNSVASHLVPENSVEQTLCGANILLHGNLVAATIPPGNPMEGNLLSGDIIRAVPLL